MNSHSNSSNNMVLQPNSYGFSNHMNYFPDDSMGVVTPNDSMCSAASTPIASSPKKDYNGCWNTPREVHRAQPPREHLVKRNSSSNIMDASYPKSRDTNSLGGGWHMKSNGSSLDMMSNADAKHMRGNCRECGARGVFANHLC
jgi:hypothetical protein